MTISTIVLRNDIEVRSFLETEAVSNRQLHKAAVGESQKGEGRCGVRSMFSFLGVLHKSCLVITAS